jgi:hypothetical protein
MESLEQNLENKDYLIREFKEKMKRDRKIPTARSIDKDYRFPTYKVFRKVFCNQRIRQIELFREKIRKFKLLFEIEENLCEDCTYNKKTCGRKIESCKNKASLYFKHYQKIE